MNCSICCFFHSKQPLSRLHWLLRYWPAQPAAELLRYLAAIERRLRRLFEMKRYFAGADASGRRTTLSPTLANASADSAARG